MPELVIPRTGRLREAGRRAGLVAVSALVSGAAAVRSGPREPYRPEDVRRILAIRLDPLGDLLLTRPALAAVRAKFPEAQLDLLALPFAALVGRLFPELDACYAYDVHQLRPSGNLLNRQNYTDLARLLATLRGREYDVALSFCGRVSSFFAWASGARWRFGLRGEAAANTLTHAVPGRRYHRRRHEAEYCLAVAAAAGANERPPFRPIQLPDGITRPLGERFPEWFGATGQRIVIHPGASNGWAKRWTPEGFGAVARQLVSQRGALVALTGSRGEADLTSEIASAVGAGVINLAGQVTLPELAGVMAAADLVISGDSGPLHLATQLGRPVVGIYGPSDPALSGPFSGQYDVVRLDLPCSPCYNATAPAICPLGHHRCMRDLAPAGVIAAAERRLAPARPSLSLTVTG